MGREDGDLGLCYTKRGFYGSVLNFAIPFANDWPKQAQPAK
jgi:hypothetical protein